MKAITQLIAISALASLSNMAMAITDNQKGIFDFKYSVTSSKKDDKTPQITPVMSNCRVNIAAITDLRTNKESIGTNYFKALRPKGMDQWLLDYHAQSLVPALTSNDTASKTIDVKPELVRMYAYSQGLSIRGNIGMRVIMTDNTGKEKSMVIRGYSSRTNWASKMLEYGSAVNKASVQLTENITSEIESFCNEA